MPSRSSTLPLRTDEAMTLATDFSIERGPAPALWRARERPKRGKLGALIPFPGPKAKQALKLARHNPHGYGTPTTCSRKGQ
ncbi:protein of unknown function [Hyphomicrobium sp. 1Nfss2.1]